MHDCTSPAYRLADTSALVLLWCGEEIYRSGAVGTYARKLDLKNGKELLRRCNAVWPDYASVIRYRKLCIAETACSMLQKEEIRQVVIPAAGFSMLGIELASVFPGIEVFELDVRGMEDKRQLTAGLPYAEKSSMHCLTADIADTAASAIVLGGAGWKRSEPTLLIIEGISYYVPKTVVRNQWELVAGGSPIILEYLVPSAAVHIGRRQIPEKIFREIISYCECDQPVTRWSERELENETAVTLEHCFSLHEIEKNSSDAKIQVFPGKKDGWIEVAILRRTGG